MRTLRCRHLGWAVASIVLAGAAGCAAEPDRPPSAPATTPTGRGTPEASATSPSATPSAPSAPPVAITRCSDVRLPAEGVGEVDFAVDAAEGLLGIHFSDTRDGEYRNVSYTVRYLADPSCGRTPSMVELIGRVDPPGWSPRRAGGRTGAPVCLVE